MNTSQEHKHIDFYFSQFHTESDEMTQFYDACIIAKNALLEVDKLQKIINEIHQVLKTENMEELEKFFIDRV